MNANIPISGSLKLLGDTSPGSPRALLDLRRATNILSFRTPINAAAGRRLQQTAGGQVPEVQEGQRFDVQSVDLVNMPLGPNFTLDRFTFDALTLGGWCASGQTAC